MGKFQLFFNEFITRKAYITVLDGLKTTVEIAVFGLLIGVVIGTLIAVTRVLPKYKVLPRILDKISAIYVGFFRGTPMIVQLLIGYYVLMPALDIQIDATVTSVIIFGLNSGAYVSEIMRGGILSVDKGQLEAGRALGMSYSNSMFKIVVPQAIKNILPTLGNEFITLIKETSIVSMITVTDLTKAFRSIANANYEYVVPYLFLAVIYLVLVLVATLLVKLLERRLAKSDRSC